MTALRVQALGPLRVEAAGEVVRLPPAAAAVLLRLLVAGGDAVTVDELFRDVWCPGATTVRRPDRVSVQKRILQLRTALNPGAAGESSPVLRTERGRVCAYRLVAEREQIDLHHFPDLVGRAFATDPVTAAALLEQALALWRGRPLFAVESLDFARPEIGRLRRLHRDARRELVRIHRDLGRPARALELAESLASELPGDRELAASVTALRARVRSRGGALLRRELVHPRVSVAVTRGDLLDEPDAHLVVGFTDTFDTATAQDEVISGASVQGQLVRRLYDGDHPRLDRELRAALRQFTPAAKERRADKRRGKLLRYPIGTVAALSDRPGRRVFAVAYSRMGNDLVARSGMAELRCALDRLWESVYLHGQLRPVAMPLVGSGLARIDAVDHEALLPAIIESFVTASRRRLFATELRVVLRPDALERAGLHNAAAFLEKL